MTTVLRFVILANDVMPKGMCVPFECAHRCPLNDETILRVGAAQQQDCHGCP
jgi:hypothetical protein